MFCGTNLLWKHQLYVYPHLWCFVTMLAECGFFNVYSQTDFMALGNAHAHEDQLGKFIVFKITCHNCQEPVLIIMTSIWHQCKVEVKLANHTFLHFVSMYSSRSLSIVIVVFNPWVNTISNFAFCECQNMLILEKYFNTERIKARRWVWYQNVGKKQDLSYINLSN